MPFEKGKSGNPGGRRKEKKVRDALVKLLADLDEGADDLRSLLKVWKAIYAKAIDGDLAAAKEMFDRHDGKVPQALIGGDEDDEAIKITSIERIIVRPPDKDG